MDRRFALLLAPLALALLAAAPHRKPAAPPPMAPLGPTARVSLETTMGLIVIELDHGHAPVSSDNFMRYVVEHRLDGTTFYRSMHLAWGAPPNGLIQGGTQMNPRRVLPPIVHEPTSATGLSHKAGTISMARYAPGTATGDFSIMLSDQPGLDADPKAADPEVQAGFAAFGHVVEGMDVVRAIFDAPRSETLGEGVMKGQMIAAPVVITRAVRLPDTAPPPMSATAP